MILRKTYVHSEFIPIVKTWETCVASRTGWYAHLLNEIMQLTFKSRARPYPAYLKFVENTLMIVACMQNTAGLILASTGYCYQCRFKMYSFVFPIVYPQNLV